MDYEIFKLKFPYGIHIGNKSLDCSNNTFFADTLFSALCIEALKDGQNKLDTLLDFVKNDKLQISDAFPFLGDELFLPKPYMQIVGDDEGSSTQKKLYKKMKYVAMSMWKDYLSGNLNPIDEIALEKQIGWHTTVTHCAIRGLDETKPYRIGTYRFAENAGLYLIYGYENKEVKNLFFDLLDGLSFSGIGGKRSAGLGRFEIYSGKLPEEIKNAIDGTANRFMTLSISLPKDDEMDFAIQGSSYLLEKRSGFVESTSYSQSYMRKNDLFMFAAGSVFAHKYSGDVYDVSAGGNHPVYKYGKPLLLGV